MLTIDSQASLAADKSNFQIGYSDIIKVGMTKSQLGISTARAGYMLIVSKNKKRRFDIIAGQRFEDCVSIETLVNDK